MGVSKGNGGAHYPTFPYHSKNILSGFDGKGHIWLGHKVCVSKLLCASPRQVCREYFTYPVRTCTQTHTSLCQGVCIQLCIGCDIFHRGKDLHSGPHEEGLIGK